MSFVLLCDNCYLVYMTQSTTSIPKGPFGFLLYSTRHYRVAAFCAVLAVFVASTLGSLVPYLFKRIVDSIGGVVGFGPDGVIFWVVLYVVFSFTEQLSWRASGFGGMYWSTGVRATVR